MASWLDTATFASQWSETSDLDGPVPRPDEYPETAATSRSYWIREHSIDLDLTCADSPLPGVADVVIIGSGITGAVAAYHLSEKQPDIRVVLVEARGICSGATGRNGGFMARPECYQLVKAADSVGVEEAIRLRKLITTTRDMMLDCIERLDAAAKVDLRLNGNIIVFETAQERDAVLGDLEFARKHGYNIEGYYVDPSEASKRFELDIELCKYGGAYLEKAGTFYPRKFVHLLLRTALIRMENLTVHPFTPVTAVTKNIDGTPSYEVHTTKGIIRTCAVFHATNAYAGNICPDLKGSNGVFGAKAHLLAMRPNTPDCQRQMQYGFGYADCWHYMHQRLDKGPFLYGHADAEILYDYDDTITLPVSHAIRPKMAEMLERSFPAWFQNIDLARDVAYDWTGIQGFTITGASIVGRPSKASPGEFASVGHNGEGMTRCFSCAVVAIDAMLAYMSGEEYTPPEWFPMTFRRNM